MWLSFITSLFGGNGVKGPITTLIERFVPDANGRAQAQEELQKLLLEHGEKSELAQMEVNKVEAASSSVFVAGWRPAIGWTCGFALAWQFVLAPILTYLIAVAGGIWVFKVPPLPVLDNSQLWPVLTGMLGLGALRTGEKVYGVDRSTLKEA
jgi:hypothetical protein